MKANNYYISVESSNLIIMAFISAVWLILYMTDIIDLKSILFVVPVIYLLFTDISEHENKVLPVNLSLFTREEINSSHQIKTDISSAKEIVSTDTNNHTEIIKISYYISGLLDSFIDSEPIHIHIISDSQTNICIKNSLIASIEYTGEAYGIKWFVDKSNPIHFEINKVKDLSVYKDLLIFLIKRYNI